MTVLHFVKNVKWKFLQLSVLKSYLCRRIKTSEHFKNYNYDVYK